MRVFNEVLGAEVEVPDKPCRVVSLAEDLTEILFMLGAGDRVVGVSSYCSRPPEARSRPRVGTYYKVSYSRLEQFRPDLILTTSAAQRRLALEMHSRGYPVFPIPLPTSVAGVVENVRRVGVVMNKICEANALERRLLQTLSQVVSSRPSSESTVYVEIDLGSPITVGQASYVDDMLGMLGLRNIYSHRREAYFEPDFEYVAGQDPDFIIYDPKPGEVGAWSRFSKLVGNRGWGVLRAVREGRTIVTAGDVIAHYGPSLILETMPWLLSTVKTYSC